MQLGDKIRIIRKARGLSQEGLGYSLSRVSKNGVSRQAVSDWETGKSEPCLDNIRDLADVLNVTFNALLDENIDLDDPEVLNAVLNKQQVVQYQPANENSMVKGRFITYFFKTYGLTAKKFSKTIAFGICFVITLVLLIVGLALNKPLSITGGTYGIGFYVSVLVTGVMISFPIVDLINLAQGGFHNRAGDLSMYDFQVAMKEELATGNKQVPDYKSIGDSSRSFPFIALHLPTTRTLYNSGATIRILDD